MEKDRINSESISRTIHPKNNIERAYLVDNRSERNLNYLSKPTCQRKVDVVQMNPADNKFLFVPNIGTNKNRIPYNDGVIVFTKYNGGEILSAGFSGCFMMAFHFNPNADRNQIQKLMSKAEDIELNKVYIAHVANNAKPALCDAETRNLITIEAIFRPYRFGELDNPNRASSQPNITTSQAGVNNLTGGMERVEDGWISKVYLQEKVFNGDPILDSTNYQWQNQLLDYRSLDPQKMEKETLATKVFIYASICCDDSLNSSLWKMAHDKLLQIINIGAEGFAAFDRAKDLITERRNEKVRKLLNSFLLTESLS